MKAYKQFKHKRTDSTAHINQDNSCFVWSGKNSIQVPKEFIEDSNDWQEIIEKDYKILSFINSNFNTIWTPCKKDISIFCFCYTGIHLHENTILEDNKFKIHSIKRLSDGEVFTIGDIVDGNFDKKCVISKIEIISNRLYFLYDKNCRRMNLSDAKHTKQPLFTTEDGVDIFENQEFYFVNTKREHSFNPEWSVIGPVVDTKKTIENHLETDKREGFLNFSTKEKAQEYIDYNKPKYSLKDIESVVSGDYLLFKGADFFRRLKRLNK